MHHRGRFRRNDDEKRCSCGTRRCQRERVFVHQLHDHDGTKAGALPLHPSAGRSRVELAARTRVGTDTQRPSSADFVVIREARLYVAASRHCGNGLLRRHTGHGDLLSRSGESRQRLDRGAESAGLRLQPPDQFEGRSRQDQGVSSSSIRARRLHAEVGSAASARPAVRG